MASLCSVNRPHTPGPGLKRSEPLDYHFESMLLTAAELGDRFFRFLLGALVYKWLPAAASRAASISQLTNACITPVSSVRAVETM